MINIKLNYNYGYKWFDNNEIYVKGYLFDKNDNLYDEEHLISYFKNVESKNDFEKKLQEANGIFAVIIKKEAMTFVAADRTRTFPLFYSQKNDDFYISDDTYYFKDLLDCKLKKLSADEYLSTGYVTGKDTLLDNIYQIQSGEYIVIDKYIEQNFYFDYITTRVSDKSFDELQKEFLDILDRSINRLIKVADGKQIVLPLSGGYDSRLIASLLKKHNYENVLCFTYGSKDSFEVKISKQVAQALGYKWYFVEYNEETISNDYSKSEQFIKYCKYASNNSSFYLGQDYFAISYLVENKIISKESVIVPGHSGDFLAGSHLVEGDLPTKETIIGKIFNKFFTLNNIKMSKALYEKLHLCIDLNIHERYLYSELENFNLKERQSKHIVNSNRTYEWFGCKHLLPLWDKDLIVFFKYLDIKYKYSCNFFETSILNKIFQIYSIDYKKEKIAKKKSLTMQLKSLLKQLLPNYLKQLIIKNSYKDINNFYLFNVSLQKDVDKKFVAREVNDIIAYSLINKIKKGLL